MGARSMERAVIEQVELEYEEAGTGEPVLLIHAGAHGGWFKPLMEEPALAGAHRLIRYHRAGYAGSGRVAGPLSLAQQAVHARSLLRHLGIERAHVVGHSSSANMSLQLALDAALDAPEVVGSLGPLETALLTVPTGPYAPEAVGRYQAVLRPPPARAHQVVHKVVHKVIPSSHR